MQMACDILPPTEVKMAKHMRDMPLYVVCYTNVDIPIAMSGNTLAYDFNLLSLQRTCVVLGDIGLTTNVNINSAKVNIVLRRVL